MDDLPLLARIVVSSMPAECGPVFATLVKGGGDPLTVAQVQNILHAKHAETARKVMEDLDRRGVIEYEAKGVGKVAAVRFRPDWAWCASPEFRGLLFGEPVTNPEARASSPPTCQKSGVVCSSNLSPVTSSSADGREGEEERAHSPRKMTGDSLEPAGGSASG